MDMQPELFPAPKSPPVPRASGLKRDGRPVWTRYKAKTRRPCDECVIVLHESKGQGPYPRSARWSRRIDKEDRYLLCNEHADMWRADDRKRP